MQRKGSKAPLHPLPRMTAANVCYEHYEQDDRWFWGEACISKAYVQRHWSQLFDLREYIADPMVRPQNVIVARKT
jgi:hypothetical protein